jgi:hypothetical protein
MLRHLLICRGNRRLKIFRCSSAKDFIKKKRSLISLLVNGGKILARIWISINLQSFHSFRDQKFMKTLVH